MKINFYGAFRKYGDHEILDLPKGSSAGELKDFLAKHLSGKIPGFPDAALIRDSAIACNDSIVDSSHKVQAEDVVAILPPVCGG
jgi:molybdopterin converting factor small subunit